MKQFVRHAKAAWVIGAALTELAGEPIGVTAFSVASPLLPMFELYQGVQLDFSSQAWVPVARREESMDAAREAAVEKARKLEDAAVEDEHVGDEDETRRPGRGESAWSALTRANIKALRKRPDAPLWTRGCSKRSKKTLVTPGMTTLASAVWFGASSRVATRMIWGLEEATEAAPRKGAAPAKTGAEESAPGPKRKV